MGPRGERVPRIEADPASLVEMQSSSLPRPVVSLGPGLACNASPGVGTINRPGLSSSPRGRSGLRRNHTSLQGRISGSGLACRPGSGRRDEISTRSTSRRPGASRHRWITRHRGHRSPRDDILQTRTLQGIIRMSIGAEICVGTAFTVSHDYAGRNRLWGWTAMAPPL
jgi:hypothetical protein